MGTSDRVPSSGQDPERQYGRVDLRDAEVPAPSYGMFLLPDTQLETEERGRAHADDANAGPGPDGQGHGVTVHRFDCHGLRHEHKRRGIGVDDRRPIRSGR